MTLTKPRARWVTATVVAAALVFASAGDSDAQSVRLGTTFVPVPANGRVHRFPSIAYDGSNDAYLVVWTHVGAIGARYVSGEGALLGATTQVNTSPFARQAGAVGVSCGLQINTCLITWIEESPFQVLGRLVRYVGGTVVFLTNPFVVANTLALSSSAPDVAYSSGSNEFLVAWTAFGPTGTLDVMAQRVSPAGFPVGAGISVGGTVFAEFYPTVAYNSAQNEFLVAYILNDTTVIGQRIQPGTGAAIGGGTPLYASVFEGYPEIAYDTRRNRYLVISWHTSTPWVIHGVLTDGNATPLTGTLTLASLSGGDGIGLAYSPVTDSYLGVFQSQLNDEVWGTEINVHGGPSGPFQITASGTRLAPQPMSAADLLRPRWLTVAPNGLANVMGQFVGVGAIPTAIGSAGAGGGGPTPPPPTGCPSIQPAPNWVCVGSNWLPPTTSGGSGNPSCPSIQPALDWVCVNGNWMPPTVGSGGNPSCPSVQPGPNWQCVSGNWLPPAPGSGNPSCPSVQPAPDWVCVNGNWLPGAGGGGGNASCPSIQPAPNWVCVNGNWLPGAGGGGNASCPSIQPAPDWVCVSGNWLPGAGGGGNASCPSIQPGPGWICSNGNWLPGGPVALTGSCTSIQPAPDWLCSNGNWLPPTLACSSIQPGPGWTCQPSSGNWLPPGFGGDD